MSCTPGDPENRGDDDLPAKRPRLEVEQSAVVGAASHLEHPEKYVVHASENDINAETLNCDTATQQRIATVCEEGGDGVKKGGGGGKDGEVGALLVEEDVGVTEFISKHKGFSGTLKQRYSDFVVNEINAAGEVVQLTRLSLPAAAPTEASAASSTSSTQTPGADSAGGAEVALSAELGAVLSADDAQRLRTLVQTRDASTELLIKVGVDKERRKRVHEAIRAVSSLLDSTTVDKDAEKYVSVKFVHRKADRRPDGWQKSAGDYTKFVLYKENKDTLDAINLLAKLLRVKPSVFSYAGTKDRRAKTSQEITAFRVLPQRLLELNKRLRNLAVGNFSQCKEPLRLGDHRGNRFIILLRNVSGSEGEIREAVGTLRDVGFINYYGMQRFGTTSVPTHHVGRALLCGAWAEAIELILRPRDGDRVELAEARRVWVETGDAGRALQALRGLHCTEQQLLHGLSKFSKNDLVSALNMIPRSMRLMYVHAYQSVVWNEVVSRRIAVLGLQPCVGDLVLGGRERVREGGREGECKGNQEEQAGGLGGNEDFPELDGQGAEKMRPVVLTPDTLAQYALTDVVLPMPGHDIVYPQHEAALWYREVLARDGLQDYSWRSTVRDYALPGCYRKCVVRPCDVRWEVVKYSDYLRPLVNSDYDLLTAPTEPGAPTDPVEGRYRALRLELSLPSSAYATMAVRELLKCGTSAAYQTTLNVT